MNTAQLPAWAWCCLFIALSALISGSIEQHLFDRLVGAVTRRIRRARAWRALAQRRATPF